MNRKGFAVVEIFIVAIFAVFIGVFAHAVMVTPKPETVKNVRVDNIPLVPIDNAGGKGVGK